MTNREILTKAIQKAIDGGFTVPGTLAPGESYLGVPPTWEIRDPFNGDKNLRIFIVSHMIFGEDWSWSVPDIIFNHDFAKALWGDADVYMGSIDPIPTDLAIAAMLPVLPRWQSALQQMVIDPDPIKYLEGYLD